MKTYNLLHKSLLQNIVQASCLSLLVLLTLPSSLADSTTDQPPSDIHVGLKSFQIHYGSKDPAKKMDLDLLFESSQYDIVSSQWNPDTSSAFYRKLQCSDSTGARWSLYSMGSWKGKCCATEPFTYLENLVSGKLASPNAKWLRIEGSMDVQIAKRSKVRETQAITVDVDSHSSANLEHFTISPQLIPSPPKGEINRIELNIKGEHKELIRRIIISSETGEQLLSILCSKLFLSNRESIEIDAKHQRIQILFELWDQIETVSVPIDIKFNLGQESHS